MIHVTNTIVIANAVSLIAFGIHTGNVCVLGVLNTTRQQWFLYNALCYRQAYNSNIWREIETFSIKNRQSMHMYLLEDKWYISI